jgi:hypothetical protein
MSGRDLSANADKSLSGMHRVPRIPKYFYELRHSFDCLCRLRLAACDRGREAQ